MLELTALLLLHPLGLPAARAHIFHPWGERWKGQGCPALKQPHQEAEFLRSF